MLENFSKTASHIIFACGATDFRKQTDYRKVSLTLSDDAAELLKQTVDEYESMGLDRKYCTSELIRIVCEAVKPNE